MNIRLLEKLMRHSFEFIHLPQTVNRHFSYLTYKNHIVSWGFSKLKTSPKAVKFGYKWGSLHSEFDAVLKFPENPAELCHFSLINTRVNTKGLVCNSKPCPTCTRLIQQFNFREVWFTNQDGNFQELEL